MDDSENGVSLHEGNKRILIGCYEVPGYGGISTASYKLFAMLAADGFDIHYINIINEADADYFRLAYGDWAGNPKKLVNVHRCILDRPLFQQAHGGLASLIAGINPDLMVGMGYIAALLMKQAERNRNLIFFTSGSKQAQSFITQTGIDLIELSAMVHHSCPAPARLHRREEEAVVLSDLLVTHSQITQELYRYYYPRQQGKIYDRVIDYAEWIYRDALDYSGLRRPFTDRDVDVLWVANRWNRPEKNYPMVNKIMRQSPGLNHHVVGEVNHKTTSQNYHGLLTDRQALFALLGRSRTVVVPSLFDTAPGILFEGSAMGCNLIATKNCGNWSVCHDDLVVARCDAREFIAKINMGLKIKYQDHMDRYLAMGSYQMLKDLLLAF